MEKLQELISKIKISDEPNPFETKDIDTLASLLKSNRFKRVAVMTGAGISVNAGIPDFRSKGGLYEKLKQRGYPKPEVVFDLSVFKRNPDLFYEIGGELDTSEKHPTLTHCFLKLLEEKGILLRVYTQNIDSLELKAGLSKSKLIQAHGHFNSCRCIDCKKQAPIEEFMQHLREKQVFKCLDCNGLIKPDVVFFGEQLPEEFSNSVPELPQADLLIIIGTSLVVYPFASLANMVRKGIPRVYVNKYIEEVRDFHFKDKNVPDLAFESDCDEFFRELAEKCGWGEDLNRIIRNEAYLGALDLGTGSVRFMLFDKKGNRISAHQIDLKQYFPEPNMHEQNPLDYVQLANECINSACQGIDINLIKAIGITNQRETIVAWDKDSGEPLHNAIIWDDCRTGDICNEFKDKQDLIRKKTGLPVSTYFSATKIIWLIRNQPRVAQALSDGKCLFGTVESWVLWNLTAEKVHVTDVSNASRTLIMNLEGFWDQELCELFAIPVCTLPTIVSSAEVFGTVKDGVLKGVPFSGALGDQQAALLGHKCVEAGSGKCTYGTGAFLLVNTGGNPVMSSSGLLTTVYGKFGKNKEMVYALEGSVECAGSAVKWMMNSLGFFNSFEELETILANTKKSDGVYCVPALSGLFAPYWNSSATGIFTGLTNCTTKGHLVRAVIEGIAFRTAELLKSISKDTSQEVKVLLVDGGMTKNLYFMQEQADIGQLVLEIPKEKDLTALGAALCAGIGVGVFSSVSDIGKLDRNLESTVSPREGDVSERWRGWEEAIKKCLTSRI